MTVETQDDPADTTLTELDAFLHRVTKLADEHFACAQPSSRVEGFIFVLSQQHRKKMYVFPAIAKDIVRNYSNSEAYRIEFLALVHDAIRNTARGDTINLDEPVASA